MAKIMKIKNVGDYSRYLGFEEQHPLVCVIDYAEVSPVRHSLNNYSVYGIFFHDEAEIDLAYGCGKYDYKKGTVICVAPGQIGGKEDNGEEVMLTGWALLFHPDLLQDTIIVGYINLVLNFCQRFYNRQFITRKLENSDILVRFNNLLQSYYGEKLQLTLGLPTVQYCADKLCMSPNYFGDMFKKMTGDTASDHIRKYVIQLAKNGLAGGAPITQVAYELGFEYTQHFSRMFKKQTGVTPSAYCEELRNQ